MLGTVLVIAAVVVGAQATAPSFDFATYPVKPFDDLQARGRLRSPHRVAAEDVVGNYMELRYLGKVPVFVDDRVDMYPKSVIEDELSLLHAQSDWNRVLDRWKIDTVVWSADSPLTSVLSLSKNWQLERRYTSKSTGVDWVVYERVRPHRS